jgi:uncharacterized protein
MKGRSNGLPIMLRQMVRRIVQGFDPERVILFGSHARGTATGDSDVDLLVVLPVAGSKREKRLEIRSALRDFDVAKDVIVVTPDDWQRFRNIGGTVVYPAVREGRELYVRPA